MEYVGGMKLGETGKLREKFKIPDRVPLATQRFEVGSPIGTNERLVRWESRITLNFRGGLRTLTEVYNII